ncbi:RagB/SusD family nutrient uptake outer membrane protein [Terrimonas sp.]|uniref:RagB/SusD family nutrient uptake outer membrane protein n=1 Tax=Terrimonas sp. TaxID=1914338 RepID=UPI000D516282|nr:RagB/SusD family nutrient uptake outer membrane protein [Terrimonas sp.]PVD52226.1 RagB/SusD family nutrient uptake outer membrane protein [Terrimonas sp.]
MNTKNHITLTLFIFFTSITQSCKKFVEVDPPIDKMNATAVFKNDVTATSAILGIYTTMMGPTSPVISTGGVTLYTGLSADELYNTNLSDAATSEFFDNALLPNNSVLLNDFWFKGYNIIYGTNACIVGLEFNNDISTPLRNQLLGEALFARSFMYYYLVNLFGDVPLLLSTEYIENGKKQRTPVSQIYARIIEDLKTARDLLETSYPTSGRVRPNKWSATALLSRIYLTLGEWSFAEQQASSIINSGAYLLEQNLNNVFLSESSETIWQLMPVTSGYNTAEGRTFIPTTSATNIPTFPLTNYLLEAFEKDDMRKENWVGSKTVSGQTYYYPYKYKIWDYGQPVREYYVVFRLAEQYLIRAECYARQDKIIESKNDLNIIRNRSGLANTLANTSKELVSAIENERRIELFAEWGHRWFDLKRNKKASEILALIKPAWQVTDTLYPIPSGEILKNSSLQQNKGY